MKRASTLRCCEKQVLLKRIKVAVLGINEPLNLL